jgi:hypothetical protein
MKERITHNVENIYFSDLVTVAASCDRVKTMSLTLLHEQMWFAQRRALYLCLEKFLSTQTSCRNKLATDHRTHKFLSQIFTPKTA